MKKLITDIFGCHDKVKVKMTSYLNNGYDVMNCFAKFEKFLPHTTFYDCRKSNSRIRAGGGILPPPPHKIDGQNTPYKSRLRLVLICRDHR